MTKDISYISLLYFLILLVPTFYIIHQMNAGTFLKKSYIAICRMIFQLLLLGFYLNYIFQLNNTILNCIYLLFMILVSTHSVLDTILVRDKKILIMIFLSILVPFIFALLVFEGLVLRLDNSFDAMYLIPIAGMLLGNSLNSLIIVLNDFLNSMVKQKDEYMFYITMGATKKEALKPYISSAMTLALKPKIANMATIGLVSIPGMMTGQILGGNGPMIAIKYQIAIMISIFFISVVGPYILLKLVEKIYFDKYSMIDEKLVR